MCGKCRTKYVPHGFQFLKIKKGNKEIVKMFSNFGNDWRLNSGVVRVQETDNHGEYDVHGYSGSVYTVHKESEGHMSAYCAGVLSNFLKQSGHDGLTIQQISIDEAIKLVEETNA